MKGLDTAELYVMEADALHVCNGPRAGARDWTTDEDTAARRLVTRGLIYTYECERCQCLHPLITKTGREVLRIVRSLKP